MKYCTLTNDKANAAPVIDFQQTEAWLSWNYHCKTERKNIYKNWKKMAGDISSIPELDQKKYDTDEQVKIICLGDSAVGKSK